MTPGTCTACHAPAEQAPSGRWWHIGPPCPNTGVMVYSPVTVVGGVMGVTPASQLPARFAAKEEK